MTPTRLEAFSDGVIAIIITIMVLGLKVPTHADITILLDLQSVFVAYVLSFLVVAIYWINHHHLIHHAEKINTKILWSNMHFLFWLSLIPFVTATMGANKMTGISVPLYIFIAFMCAFAYYVLGTTIRTDRSIDRHGGHEEGDTSTFILFFKNYFALCVYTIAFVVSFWLPYLGVALVFIPAGLYFIPRFQEE